MHDAYTPTTFIRHGRPLRGVMIDNQPWFAAQDLARLLGIGYPQRFHHRFRPHETRRIHVLYATDSEEPLDMINEAGLYKALIRFGHPESQHLDQWLSREVIPTLRDQHTPDHRPPPPRTDELAGTPGDVAGLARGTVGAAGGDAEVDAGSVRRERLFTGSGKRGQA
ncbi:BRO-N domain-containing protein [Pseudomonas citronellolis]|uniref:BRO-N domain-containing protein n=1 Tax=Pseudomonas citronellolis TaxID=53408 RepID=UPI002D79D80F|nr:Bro-N domain-containing protein [Pseudomonas citronellolis]WRT85403.1 Bro-N domain-containing protein [Pseudomonas citronellolis]